MRADDFLSKSWFQTSHERKYRVVRFDGETVRLSHVLWNLAHPEDQVKRGEIVHHKNNDSLDDRVDNYKKMTKKDHDDLHRPALRTAVSKAKRGVRQPLERVRRRAESHKLARAKRRKWKPSEALELRRQGLSMKKIGKKLGVNWSTPRRHFRLRGVVY